ncbi:hypothetical protein PATA110615_01070 [Paenibacillus taichungensis]
MLGVGGRGSRDSTYTAIKRQMKQDLEFPSRGRGFQVLFITSKLVIIQRVLVESVTFLSGDAHFLNHSQSN